MFGFAILLAQSQSLPISVDSNESVAHSTTMLSDGINHSIFSFWGMIRWFAALIMAMLEAPWLYLEGKLDHLDPEAYSSTARPRHSSTASEIPGSSGVEEADTLEYSNRSCETGDDASVAEGQMSFMSTAALLAERARLQEELRIAEAEEEPL